jgi:deazaflavin-dependent oxidoreductase (nitroreductase family)
MSRRTVAIRGEATGEGAKIRLVTEPDHLSAYAAEEYCYLTTQGRRTGNPHTIEIWFAVEGGVVYMMAGGRERSDWVANLIATPAVRIQIGDHDWDALARVVEPDTEEDERVRPLLREKYANASDDLVSWARTALPVALEITGAASDG